MIGKNDKYKKQKCHMCLQSDHPIIGDDLGMKPLYEPPYTGTS